MAPGAAARPAGPGGLAGGVTVADDSNAADWLPAGELTVGITAGASCPNNLIEDTIRRLFQLRGISVAELLKK